MEGSTLNDPQTAVNYCQVCPKLCNASCPVADADPQEASTPWGKMTTMKQVNSGQLPVEDYALAYKCFNCGRSEPSCDLGNPIPETLDHYRSKAFATLVAPKVIYEFCEKFSKFNNPYGKDLKKILHQQLPKEISDSPKRGVYFPGCTEINFQAPIIKRTLDFFSELGTYQLGLYQEPIQCCGAPLFLAGDMERFKEMAEVNSHLLNGYEFIVSSASDCLYTMKSYYAAVGFPIKAKIMTTPSYILPMLKNIWKRTGRQPMPPMAYHDACTLGGRRLAVYQEPRELLELVSGQAPLEFTENREHSGCCGDGGLLSLTYPHIAQKVTQMFLEEFHKTGASLLITTTPSCQMRLQKTAPHLAVKGLMEFIIDSVKI